jgi:hypothetical protein
MSVEYRTWTSIADLPFDDEAAWLPLTRQIEQSHPELGPVVTWDDTALVVILADDQPDPAAAAEQAAKIINDALRTSSLGNRVPKVFQVEAANAVAAA